MFFDRAEKDVQHVLSVDNQNIYGLNNLGIIQQRRGNVSDAKNNYRTSCKRGYSLACENFRILTSYEVKDESSVLIEKSRVAIASGNYQQAINYSSEAISVEPRSSIAHCNRAAAYAYTNNFDKALNDANTAINLDPNMGLAYNNKGFIFERQGNREDAILNYAFGCRLGESLACNNQRRAQQH